MSKRQIVTLVLLLIIVFSLPIAIFLTKKGQEIRPHALQGQANFLLSADSTTSTVGKIINVVVSLQLTDSALKVSGVDFILLYDKSKLDVLNVVPQIKSVDPNAAFTDAPIISSGGVFDDTYNFIRVAEIARMADQYLPTGTFTLAKITFVGRAQGIANIKFPDDNKYLQIVGTGTYIPPQSSATSTPLLTPTTVITGAPPLTPTSTPSPTCGPQPTPACFVATPPCKMPIRNTCVTTPTPIPTTLGQGLISLWTMDETSGSMVADAMAANNGTATGTTVVTGETMYARQFNGLTDYITVNNPSNFNFNYNSPFSIAAWINPSRGHGDYQTIVSKTQVPSPYHGFVFRLNPQSQLEFVLIANGQSPNYQFAWVQGQGTDFPVNQWHHVAVTYDGSGSTNGIQLYLDGNLLAKNPSPGNWNNVGTTSIQNTEPLLIGRQNPPTIGYTPIDANNYGNFAGILDNVRVYNRVVTANEIQALYQGGM